LQEKSSTIFLHDTPSRLNESVNKMGFLYSAGGGFSQNKNQIHNLQ